MLGWMPSSSHVWPQKTLQHQTPTSQSKDVLKRRDCSRLQSVIPNSQLAHVLRAPAPAAARTWGRSWDRSPGLRCHFPPASAPAPPPPQALLPLPKSKASSCCCSGHAALVGTVRLFTVYFSLEQALLTPPLGKNEVRQMEVSKKLPAGPYSAENQKWTYMYFLGPVSSFFTWVIYWLVHVCFVPEEKTLPSPWKVHVKWLREHYLPYQFRLSL